MLEEEGSGSPSSTLFQTKAEAMEQARELARPHPHGQVIVHRADGSVESESYGSQILHLVRD